MMILGGAYTVLLVAGVAVSFLYWRGHAAGDRRLIAVYLAALAGAFFGAKVVFLLCEGWMVWPTPERWAALAAGKTILGALLGGYAGVEIAKMAVGYRRPTGDLFAIAAPLGIAIGRVGCLLHGCCAGVQCAPAWWTLRERAGVDRWPAVPVEIGFNLLAAAGLFVLRRRRVWPGQLFHVYLMAYGSFRFLHEWLRATPRIGAGVSTYQIATLAVIVLGAVGFWRRARERHLV
jgi:phosphatidylglycerol:prolipoprotein diacylglycerol transferase